MGVNKVIYSNTTLIDLTGDTVTPDTLAEGMTAHDKRGEKIVGTMKPSSGGDNHITEVGVMVDGEPVTIRDDGSRLTTVVNADESIVETRTFLDGTTETKTTVFNADETVTETTVANGETTTKTTTFTDLGMITMNVDNGNQVHFGESVPSANLGINGDVFVLSKERQIYTPVSFIKSTGQEYIDTGFKHNQNTRVVMSAKVVTQPSAHAWLFEGRNATGVAHKSVFLQRGTAWKADYSLGSGSGRASISSVGVTDRLTIDYNKNTIKVNSFTHTWTATTFQSNYNLTLFAANTAGVVDGFIAAEMNMCQIYDNGTMVRDYVPVVNTNGEAGFYDRLNNAFEGNKGSGAFIAGEVITGVEGLPTEVKEIAMYMKINGVWTLLAEVE